MVIPEIAYIETSMGRGREWAELCVSDAVCVGEWVFTQMGTRDREKK